MPNNFKLSGDYYVSKAGNDSNDGLTPETPKRTVQAALNLATSGTRTIIIGSGVYKETLSKIFGGSTSIYADGEVIIETLSGTGSLTFSFSSPHTYSIVGITFRNINSFSCGLGITANTAFTSCKFINSYFIGSGNSGQNSFVFDKCILIGCSSNGFYTGGGLIIRNSIYINTGLLWLFSSFLNTYINSNSYFYTISGGGTASNFNYNNIQGFILINATTSITTGTYQDIYGRYYDLSIAGNNTTLDAGTLGNPYYRSDTLGKFFYYSTHKILYPTYNVNSISQDPLFNDILSQDFTLQAGSPHIGRASDGINNIGGTRYAIRAAANSSSFSGSSATVDAGLTFSYDNYVISGSAVTGSVTSAPIFISSSAKVIQEIDYNGLLAFNKDTGSLSGSNVNVPDFDTYTSASGNPGANPDRLVYYMRLTTGSTQPVVDADWENGNLWTRGDYNVFEWGTKPSIDVYGRGNGDPNFVVANSSFLRATYIQMKVKLRNNYLL